MRINGDRLLYYSLLPFASTAFIVIAASALVMASEALPALGEYGPGIYVSSGWRPSEDPANASYGLLPAIAGTLATAVIAVAIAAPLSIAAVILSEEMLPSRAREAFSNIVDVMAGLPTIVYGVWGLAVLAPLLEGLYRALNSALGFLPVFACEPVGGLSILTAGILLAVMITPFMFAVVKESYRLIPVKYREAAWALGATRMEYTAIMMSMIKPAIIAAALLGFGRAAGETVAVALVVGNSIALPYCLIGPGVTVSALIANQFAEANLYPYMQSALYAGGLALLVLGLVSNTVGVLMLSRVRSLAES